MYSFCYLKYASSQLQLFGYFSSFKSFFLTNSVSTSFNFRSTPLSASESSFCSLQLPETFDISPTLEVPEIVDISSSDNSVEILSPITSSSVKSSYC